jgi:hypothetical protein
LWSWPNVYRDQHGSGGQEGKEVCDLLVVFGRHVFIFSDKYSVFPDSGDLQRDWSRWFRRAIWKSAHQIWGAERWITRHPDRVFVDRKCTERLPVRLPGASEIVFHRIVVAHGAGARCVTALGGSASMMILPHIAGRAHFEPVTSAVPFAVGLMSRTEGFVHVIDDFSLDVVLRTIDTAPDLARYLRAKEEFILSGRLGSAAGEEELLASYLRCADKSGEHYFRTDGADVITVGEGLWERFQRHPERSAQIGADQISYLWDEIIDRFTEHTLAGTQHFVSGSTSDIEIPLRLMAAERRTNRRALAKHLLAIVNRSDGRPRDARVVGADDGSGRFYVFLTMTQPPGVPHDEYREIRRNMLQAYCLVVRRKRPDAKDIIGIATEAGAGGDGRSEDLVYLDGRFWNDDLETEAARLEQELEILRDTQFISGSEPEYPLARDLGAQKGRNRNKACHCGSGKKYKNCCGAAG